jgi:L-fuculokinase
MDVNQTAAAHTLVLDIGKSHAKLVLFNDAGDVMTRCVQANAPVTTDGYTALGTQALRAWLLQAIPALPERERIARMGITTHGAAFCALGDDDLAMPPIDYEWDGYGPSRQHYASVIDGFDVTGTPLLPQGLNAGLQLFWLQQNRPQAWSRVRHWVPYPQYWAWWLTGEVASEATSLGCHTHLWQPHHQIYAPWAVLSGLVKRFAPLRPAHDVLGTVRPDRAKALGLSPTCQVHVGLHDSNACLARHLHALPRATVVSTGTWTVVMRAGFEGDAEAGPALSLDPNRDELFNQSIDGRAVPTARFMGGREFAFLCHGADPALATVPALREAVDAGWAVLPDDLSQPDAVHGRVSTLCQGEQRWHRQPEAVPAPWRPALAAWYAACMTAHMVQRLCAGSTESPAAEPVIVEGPMAQNPAFVAALAALVSPRPLVCSQDEVEGTARGAWLSTRWQRPSVTARYTPVPLPPPTDVFRLQRAWTRWLNLLTPRDGPLL